MASNNADIGIGQNRIARRTLLRKGVAVAGGLTIGGVGTVGADGNPQTFTRDFTGLTRDIPCKDEKAELTQAVQLVRIYTTGDDDGGIHFNATLRWDPLVVAVGQESGIEWSGQGMKSYSQTLRGPFPQTFTRVDNTILSADGSTDNMRLHRRIHYTVDANGKVTAIQTELTVECFG